MIHLLTTLIGIAVILIAYKLTEETNDVTNDNPFAVEHIDGYDVTEVRFVRNSNGNWTATNVTYERMTD